MTEAIYQFDFSEDTINKRSRDMLFVFSPVLIVCLGGFVLFITDFKIKETLLCFGQVLLIMLVIGAVEIPLINRRSRKIKVFIYDDKIIKQCGKHENTIPWDNIARIKINENNKGEIVYIQLRGRDKTTLWLDGLNEMGKLAGLIRERISGDILVNTKRGRLDQRMVCITSVIITTIITTIVIAIIASFGAEAMEIFAILIAFGVSCFLLLFRPLSKRDASPKWLETVFSLLMFLLGIYGLVSFLLSRCLT